jgi:peptide/nickel transport system ATP-binding protein
MALLTLESVSVSIHGTPILKNITTTIDAGEVLGVIGESGSGKSMTALAIMGLLPTGSELTGTITFDGLKLNELDEAARCKICGDDIGMVFQEPMTALNPVHTIGQQVVECIRLHQSVSKQQAEHMAMDTLARCGLPPEQFPLSRYPHELSGGQRQRVVIAMAVALKPKLLICDEPTTALDVTTQAEILNLLRALQKSDDMALMFISHDLAVVAGMANRVAIMRHGEILEQGGVEPVFSALSHPYTRALFEASDHVPSQHLAKVSARASQDTSGSSTTTTTASDTAADAASISQSDVLLAVDNLRCEYRVRATGWFGRAKTFTAVDDVSFAIHAGESVGLVGESGCGKSTLARALLGLTPRAGGAIRVNGQSIDAGISVLKNLQVVFQDPYGSFNPRHRVARLVAEPLNVLQQQPNRKDRNQLVAGMLESVGMQATDADKYIHEFSGGQRQRIAIARALIVKPALILLDEAVSALDVSVRATVLDLLAELAGTHQLAYLFISHDLSVVKNVTDRVLVMRSGKIVERGVTHDVFNHPKHEYTQRLVASVPQLPDYQHATEHSV